VKKGKETVSNQQEPKQVEMGWQQHGNKGKV